jgi:hypothetical protein
MIKSASIDFTLVDLKMEKDRVISDYSGTMLNRLSLGDDATPST